MNKILIGVGFAALVVLGWFLVFQGDTVTYVAEVNNEVAALEAELAEIEAAVQAGTLTPEAAAEAQVKIAARLEAINGAIASSEKVELSSSQRTQLMDGLDRLKDILTKYQATLVVVDEVVMELPPAERPQLNRSNGGRASSIVAVIADTVEVVEEHVEEVVEEYEPEEDAHADGDMMDADSASSSDDATMNDENEDVDVDAEAAGDGEASVEMPTDDADGEEMIDVDMTVEGDVSTDEAVDDTATSDEEVMQ